MSSKNTNPSIKQKRSIEADQRRFGSNQFQCLKEQEAPSGSEEHEKVKRDLTPKMPPIIIGQPLNDVKETLSGIKTWGTDVYFKLIRGQQAIMTSCDKDYQIVIQKLCKSKIKYFTYTPTMNKTKKLVLKGLPTVYTLDEIKEDLFSKVSDIVNITLLKSRSFSGTARSQSYLVQLPWSKNVKEVTDNVRFVCNFAIKWEDFVKPRQFCSTQCYKCQQFGHVASNCGYDPRCVKCSLSHESKFCPKMKEEPAKCANCGKNHPASYRGCETHKEYEKSIRPKKNTLSKKSTNGHRSYSEVVKGITIEAKQNTNVSSAVPMDTDVYENADKQECVDTFESLNKRIQHSFGMTFFEFVEQVKEYNQEFTKCSGVASQELTLSMKFISKILKK